MILYSPKQGHFPCTTIIAIFCLVFTASAYHSSKRDFDIYADSKDNSFSEGDVLVCQIESNIAASIYGAEHVMLAVSSSEVVHISVDESDVTKGELKRERYDTVKQQKHYKTCRKGTVEYDRVMLDLGISPKLYDVATRDAERDIGRTVYYNVLKCNCEHWVTYWKYGSAWSVQSWQPPNADCSLPNNFKNGARASSTSYNQNNGRQVGARSMAVAGEARIAAGVLNIKALGPNVGAHAEAGTLNTGVGFKAGIGEVSGKIGRFGGTLGLNVDTEVGVGLEGAGLKVLGTGFTLSKSKGFSVCFFGNCLHIT